MRKLARTKRWILAASVALTGGFAAIAANSFPGRKSATSAVALRDDRGESEAPASESSGETPGGLRAPSQAPQSGETQESGQESAPSSEAQSPSETPVISGGS